MNSGGIGVRGDVLGYDDAGNRTISGYTTGDHNRLTSDGTYNYTYDDAGNIARRTKIGTNEVDIFYFDHRNRLTRIKSKTGPTVTKDVRYNYDVFNRLVRAKVDADGAGSGGWTYTYWAYDGANPVLEFDGNTSTVPSHRYTWGPAVDQILADEIVDNGGEEDMLYPLIDWQGTVRDLATYVNGTTTIQNHKIYNAFGNVQHETNAAVDTIFGYTGRYFDNHTDLQWNLNRWYDPEIGRWLSEDPINFEGGDANLYRYVGNQPNMGTDPSGLANLWSPITWGLPNACQSWWGFCNPLSEEGLHGWGALGRGYVDTAVSGEQISSTSGFIDAGNDVLWPFGEWKNDYGPQYGQETAYDQGCTVGVGTGLAINTVLTVSGVRGVVTAVRTVQTAGGLMQVGRVTLAGGGTVEVIIVNGQAVALTARMAANAGIGTAGGCNIVNSVGQGGGTDCGASKGGNLLDQTQKAKDAFRSDKNFSRWWHRKYKAGQKMSGGGRHNPDLPEEDILNGYLEWLELGKPKG